MSDKKRIILLSGSMLLLIAAALFVYARFDPERSNLFPKCMFYTLTGFQCPGCGSQRAVHHLLNGNFIEALRYNALVVLAIPYVVIGFVIHLIRRNRFTDFIYTHFYSGKSVYIVLLAVVFFWIIRNIVTF